MIKVKVSELSGPALDWAVAKADGLEVYPDEDVWRCDISPSNAFHTIGRVRTDREGYSPSTDWGQAGPLIDKYDPDEKRLGLPEQNRGAEVWLDRIGGDVVLGRGRGDTRLVAFCRALVDALVEASLGPEIEVPEELFHST